MHSAAKPFDGIRILAAEGMQALPFATQLLARMGAEVVKVERPGSGDSGRSSEPAMIDPHGRRVGATFLRNNLYKKSIVLDLKQPEGREIFAELAGGFDIVAENFTPGAMTRMGLGEAALRKRWPALIYLSVSGFGNAPGSPYRTWPAYAPVAEAMSGIYTWRDTGQAPIVSPLGGVADIGTGMFATVGLLAALRLRDLTGQGQFVDIAMMDSMLAYTDVVSNFWSMDLHELPPLLMHACRAADGWFVLQVGREHQFARLADILGCPEWLEDARLATRAGWVEHFESIIRPRIERWAGDRTKLEACASLAEAGIAAGPCLTGAEVVSDQHVAVRRMMTEIPRTDGVEKPVLMPGNPVKMSGLEDAEMGRVPWLGEHTDEVLSAELSLAAGDLDRLRAAGVIG
ncbi:CaiB/BaiF CoA transferase family protein [Nocardioides sp. Bht2]|uniref:CaiB/BaiF CoA transferase family protein n=1 Tax=Nocardioides sp. Bht2 TaxID=3392297 RepID=UPI0039B3C20F